MRIDPKLLVTPISSQTTHEAPQAKRSKRNTGASVVSLSSAGTAVIADSDESEPSPRVERLKMMVEQGTYQVDLETLASRIVDDDFMRRTGS
jgi:anti-sigma28 factor (negative regulator of flagellin synthesis)